MRLRCFVLWSPLAPDALSATLAQGLADGRLVGSVDGRTFRLQRAMSGRRRPNPFVLTLVGHIDHDPEGSAVRVGVRMSSWLPLMVLNLAVLAALLPFTVGPTLGLPFAVFFGGIGLALALAAHAQLRRARRRWMALVDPAARFQLINDEASQASGRDPLV